LIPTKCQVTGTAADFPGIDAHRCKVMGEVMPFRFYRRIISKVLYCLIQVDRMDTPPSHKDVEAVFDALLAGMMSREKDDVRGGIFLPNPCILSSIFLLTFQA